jgi:Fe-Mn family superoxide dismutase
MIQLPPLPYAHDALEPVLSETTLRTHHGKHHARYVEVTNTLADKAGLAALPVEDLIRQAAMSPDRKLFNNAAQAWNHAFFWNAMAPSNRPPAGPLAEAIVAAFGGLDELRARFLEEGAGHFGSGWVWLAAEGGRLGVFSTHDADTVVTRSVTPLLVCDLWEHAYYLDHKNDRAGFLGQWWDRLANWDFAEMQFAADAGRGAAWTYPLEAETYVPPIHNHGAFERALEEAGILLHDEPEAGTEHHQRFGALLERIAEYEPSAPAVGEVEGVHADLDGRIRSAARRVAEAKAREEEHWSPMVGGDVGPHADAAQSASRLARAIGGVE